MGIFGDKLRREREMRGITLDEISESTKISRRHLESLENEDFDSLPGGVFNKGFVKAYARFLGLDEDQAVADYVAVANEVPPPEDQFPLEIHEEPNRELNPKRSQLPLILAVVALVLVLAGYVARRAKSHTQGNSEGLVSAAAPAAESSAKPAVHPAAPSAAAPAPAVVDQKPAASAPKPASLPVKQSAPIATAANAEPPSSAPAPRVKPLPAERSFFVIIKAKEDAWTSVVADGRRVFHGTLRANKQRFIRAGKQIIVTTGNAGGLDVSFNGRPLGAIGSESEARTLTFTPAGQIDQLP